MRGFESFNKFKTNLKDLRQLYDITYHLYKVEKQNLEIELKKDVILNPTLKTTIDSVDHNPTALYQRLEMLYPYKLRQLILISSITALEVYLTDVILEIFQRDMTPFKVCEPVTYQRNYLLSISSLAKIQRELIIKDIRNLTSGGLKEIDKYYKKVFSIDIKNLGINFSDVEEIHTRRHLFVHRNGVTDSEYVNKFPQLGYHIGVQIKIDHGYIIATLNSLTKFAGLINKEILMKFPDINRRPQYHIGTKSFGKDLKKLMLEISILEEKFDHIQYFNDLTVHGLKLSSFIVQMTTIDHICILFLSGTQSELSSFFQPIGKHKSMIINKTIEIKI